MYSEREEETYGENFDALMAAISKEDEEQQLR